MQTFDPKAFLEFCRSKPADGAAARIRYLLDHGDPPAGFNGEDDRWLDVYAPYRIDAKQTVSA